MCMRMHGQAFPCANIARLDGRCAPSLQSSRFFEVTALIAPAGFCHLHFAARDGTAPGLRRDGPLLEMPRLGRRGGGSAQAGGGRHRPVPRVRRLGGAETRQAAFHGTGPRHATAVERVDAPRTARGGRG